MDDVKIKQSIAFYKKHPILFATEFLNIKLTFSQRIRLKIMELLWRIKK